MNITIPGQVEQSKLSPVRAELCDWFTSNNIDPGMVSNEWPIDFRGREVQLTLCGPEETLPPSNVAGVSARRPSGRLTEREYRIKLINPLTQSLIDKLAPLFGGVFEGEDPRPVREMPAADAKLDDLAQWVSQLETARAEEKAAKERAEEARVQILSRLNEHGAEFGTIDGQRVVKAKTVESSRFKTVEFRKAYPDLAAQYSATSTSVRLEVL